MNNLNQVKHMNSLFSTGTLLDLNNEKLLFSFVLSKSVRLILICFGTRRKLVYRIGLIKAFLRQLILIHKHHGPTYTIKYMKASGVALQRYLGGDIMLSLREVEPNLSFPKLINGLPQLIPTKSRFRIRQNDLGYIRLYMTLINLYRILKCPFNPKLGTITSPYNGNKDLLDLYCTILQQESSHWLQTRISHSDLRITGFNKSTKAGPNRKLSWSNLIVDLVAWSRNDYKDLISYLSLSNSKLAILTGVLIDLIQELPSWVDSAMNYSRLGKLAFKEEAAGKLRVFAICDTWTQTVLLPLHKRLFEILGKLPNDGTFDQEASVDRSAKKMLANKVSYSFDLSAATDRLPLALQIAVLNSLHPTLGDRWGSLLINRDFHILSNPYVPVGTVKYEVGQPMGALSSWAMLALTHHLLVQLAYKLAYEYVGVSYKGYWFKGYEVLGDDIVIFDSKVATKYLDIMRNLGVEINLSKSISSKSGTALEFAKRTVIKFDQDSRNYVDVSSLPWKLMLQADKTSAGRVSLFYTLTRDRHWCQTKNRQFASLLLVRQLDLWRDQGKTLARLQPIVEQVLRSKAPLGLVALFNALLRVSQLPFPVMKISNVLMEGNDKTIISLLTQCVDTLINKAGKSPSLPLYGFGNKAFNRYVVDYTIRRFINSYFAVDSKESFPVSYNIRKASLPVQELSTWLGNELEAIIPDWTFALIKKARLPVDMSFYPAGIPYGIELDAATRAEAANNLYSLLRSAFTWVERGAEILLLKHAIDSRIFERKLTIEEYDSNTISNFKVGNAFWIRVVDKPLPQIPSLKEVPAWQLINLVLLLVKNYELDISSYQLTSVDENLPTLSWWKERSSTPRIMRIIETRLCEGIIRVCQESRKLNNIPLFDSYPKEFAFIHENLWFIPPKEGKRSLEFSVYSPQFILDNADLLGIELIDSKYSRKNEEE